MTEEFKLPFARDPREEWWWWDHDFGGERNLRLSSRKIAGDRLKYQGIPIPRQVYFLGSDANELIKIGSAFDIELRVEQLQMASPVRLRVLGYVHRGGEPLERHLHRLFKQRRAHGEWFRVSLDEIFATVEAIQKRGAT